ncbi:MAG: ATP-dependent DNA helicase RecG [Peptococcaceae bacterium]|nr:ATP-dependent DNA helicase RecG [Peptococcaceae bacterium]
MEENIFSSPVQFIKNVGPRRAALLRRLGIETVGDLLYHFPRRYEDRSVTRSLVSSLLGETVTTYGVVIGGQEYRPRKNIQISKLALDGGRGVFYGVWFNQPYILSQMPPGTRLIVTGKLNRRFGAYEISVQDYEVIPRGLPLAPRRIVPVYTTTEKLYQKHLRTIIKNALEAWLPKINEFLPEELLRRHQIPSISEALYQIHNPDHPDKARAAYRRFVVEECFLFELALAILRERIRKKTKPHRYLRAGSLIPRVKASLPFHLTGAQKRVWHEIETDMQKDVPMRRLLQGDVGSGKTVIALLALCKAVESGLQGALMVPTEILAEQHYLKIKSFLKPFGVTTELLVGSMPESRKKEARSRILLGQSSIVIGTHALIQDKVMFHKLGLAVIDEQHRFGVRQRALLQEKGVQCDLLVMTATPIPRTLALTVYGDLDVSEIDEMPPGRREIETRVIPKEQLGKVFALLCAECSKGRQAYVVCPLIEESEQLNSEAAVELYRKISKQLAGQFRIGLLHGKMSAEDKEGVMEDFRAGHIDILVATTVVEVGLDVPNATVMIVFDAERFGLAQLHQLRGRVGRGSERSWCVLVADPKTEEARKRLKAIESTSDGFALAEVDLRIRGPGDFFGTKQSGLPDFRVADLQRDWRLFVQMRKEIPRYIKSLKPGTFKYFLLEQRLRHFQGKNLLYSLD